MMNEKSLPTYQQFKVKKTNHRQRKRERMQKQCSGSKKKPEGIPEANDAHLADSHPDLALLKASCTFSIVIQ